MTQKQVAIKVIHAAGSLRSRAPAMLRGVGSIVDLAGGLRLSRGVRSLGIADPSSDADAIGGDWNRAFEYLENAQEAIEAK